MSNPIGWCDETVNPVMGLRVSEWAEGSLAGMKAISLWQPWASLVAWKEKRFETRSWRPSSLGFCAGSLLAIHAALRVPRMDDWADDETGDLLDILKRHGVETGPWGLPRDVILCVCRFVRCVSTNAADYRVSHGEYGLLIGDQEKFLGDWSYGRWAWELEVVEMLDPPVPVRGGRRLWNWDGGMGDVLGGKQGCLDLPEAMR
jgi:hypothetical protein